MKCRRKKNVYTLEVNVLKQHSISKYILGYNNYSKILFLFWATKNYFQNV